MKRLLAALLVWLAIVAPLSAAQPGDALSCAANADGNWTAAATWTSCGGTAPDANDTCTIGSPFDVIMDATSGACGALTVDAGATIDWKEGDGTCRTLTVGDGLAAGTSDNTSVAGSMRFGACQSLLVSTTNSTGAVRGTITVTGYLAAAGATLYGSGRINSFGEVTGNWPARTITLTDFSLRQDSLDQYNGKVLVPTSGYFREAWFDIVTGATTKNQIVVRIDGSAAAGTHRGQVDSRNQEGREDPGVTASTTYWAPGDWGEVIDGGVNSAPATATVASGGTTVTFSGAWPGGTSRLGAFVGARFICSADIGAAASDGDVRIIESVTDTTHVVLKSAYGTASCAAGADYRIWVDNQPPVAASVQESFSAGDTYVIIDPATIGIPAAAYSDTTQDAQIGAILLTNGGTISLKNTSVGNCGNYISGASAQGCLRADDIDNANANEGLYLDRVEFHHYSGVAAIDLEDSANITMSHLSIRDSAEGGNATTVSAGTCPGDEAHGFRINDNAGDGRASGIVIEDSRIVRTNDVSYSVLTAGESDEVNCTDCAVRNTFMGFTPNSCGGSAQCVGLAEGVTRFAGNRIFCTNAQSGAGYVGQGIGTNTNAFSGYILNSLFQNTLEGGLKINITTDATGTTDANSQFYVVSSVFRNLGGSDTSGHFTRGRWIDDYFEPANKGSNQLISEPQEVKGNIVMVPPNFDNGGSVFNHEPSGTARIEPTTLREWDNAIFGPTSAAAATDSHFLGGKHGSGNDALASDADFRHNTIVGSQHLLTSGNDSGWRFRDNGTGVHVANANLFVNAAFSYNRVNGSEAVADDYNLCVKVVTNQCPVGITAGSNTLTTGSPGLFDPASADFNIRPGSTPKENLAADGYPRGVRVAGPPSWDVFTALYPFIVAKPVINNISDRDTDGDGVWDLFDNCDLKFNPVQYDGDGDGKGCACDSSGDTCP